MGSTSYLTENERDKNHIVDLSNTNDASICPWHSVCHNNITEQSN